MGLGGESEGQNDDVSVSKAKQSQVGARSTVLYRSLTVLV